MCWQRLSVFPEAQLGELAAGKVIQALVVLKPSLLAFCLLAKKGGLWCHSGGEWAQHQLKKNHMPALKLLKKRYFCQWNRMSVIFPYVSASPFPNLSAAGRRDTNQHLWPGQWHLWAQGIQKPCQKHYSPDPNASPMCGLLFTAQGRELRRVTGTGGVLG